MLFVRVAVSFALVGVLLWFFARASSGRLGSFLAGARSASAHESLELLSRRQITKSAGVALVRVGSRHLLLGTGENGVQVLAEGDDLVVAEETPTAPKPGAALAPLEPTGLETAHGRGDVPARKYRAAAWTRSVSPQGSQPARMNFFEALRELTVRRS